jgi:hypothetical protein
MKNSPTFIHVPDLMTGIVAVLVLPGVVCIVTVVGEDVVVGCAVDEPVSYNLTFIIILNNHR